MNIVYLWLCTSIPTLLYFRWSGPSYCMWAIYILSLPLFNKIITIAHIKSDWCSLILSLIAIQSLSKYVGNEQVYFEYCLCSYKFWALPPFTVPQLLATLGTPGTISNIIRLCVTTHGVNFRGSLTVRVSLTSAIHQLDLIRVVCHIKMFTIVQVN